MEIQYFDLINVYAVKNWLLPATIVHNFDKDLIKDLKLNFDVVSIQYKDYFGKIQEYTRKIVSKTKLRKRIITEKELGDILGFFCTDPAHDFKNAGVPISLGTFIKIDISKKPLVLYGSLCWENKITKNNLHLFIDGLNKIVDGYSKIIKDLKLNSMVSQPYITLRTYNGEHQKRKFNVKQFINQKKFK